MTPDMPIDDLVSAIHGLDRNGCKAELLSLPKPALDFTDEFLESHSTEWMRHVLLAAFLQARRRR